MSVTNFEGNFALINGTIAAEPFTRACLDKFLAVDKEVDVVHAGAVDGEGTDRDGVRGDIFTVENNIFNRHDIVIVGVIVEAENPCVVLMSTEYGQIHTVKGGLHLEFARIDVNRSIIGFVGGEVEAQFMVAITTSGGNEIV